MDYAEEYLRNGGTEESLGIISPYDSQALGESRRAGRFFESCKNPMESKIHERFCLGNKEKWLDICDELTETSGSST